VGRSGEVAQVVSDRCKTCSLILKDAFLRAYSKINSLDLVAQG
jgi:hypothetical protein